jgi:tetratricopeptide (TPR) repeat protein
MLKHLAVAAALLAFASGAFAQDAYEQALKAYRAGQYQRAIELLQEVVSTEPRAEAYYLLGYAHYALSQKAQARAYFQEAFLIEPMLKPQEVLKQVW